MFAHLNESERSQGIFSSVFKNECSEIRHQPVANEDDLEDSEFMEQMYQDGSYSQGERKAFVEAQESVGSKEVQEASVAKVSEHLQVGPSPRKGGKSSHT